ncbi:MAG: hypothetical protein GC200_03110 [Tepidisphaera sp.]|nr:hypothetical protein [Tepidisphaera sp.]
MAAAEILLVILASIVGLVLVVVLAMSLLVPLFKGIVFLIKHVATFIGSMVMDTARFVGSVILAILYVPLVVLNLVIGRFSACGHYGRALWNELSNAGLCLYRVALSHPLRLVGLHGLVEGVERRLPEVMANAPTRDLPTGKGGKFDGYSIVGSLAAGGSGAKLYIAQPSAAKFAAFQRDGIDHVGQVVIKSFSLQDGSSLPQIVRESRSLDAAKKLGLILDHELTADRFYYVMRYVPGEPLGMMIRRLHGASGPGGLSPTNLRSGLGYVADLVSTLSVYHRGGLWHKDVKPDNVIVDASGNAHLVDFGLVSSLRSAMTLTTHGTEYFRDPEMVRLALKGVKVHEVDGTRFDIYGAGAVLYSMVEDSFPAHGGLSQVTKRCPEALKWVIRRAMADYDKRYPSAAAMLADIDAVRLAADPFAVRPIDLPSMKAGANAQPQSEAGGAANAAPTFAAAVGAVGASIGAAFKNVMDTAAAKAAAHGPNIRVTHWWTGRAEVVPPAGAPVADVRMAGTPAGIPPIPPIVPAGMRRSAEEQLASAKAKLERARGRVAGRRAGWRMRAADGKPMNSGVGIAVLAAVGVLAFANVARHESRRNHAAVNVSQTQPPTPPEAPSAPATDEAAAFETPDAAATPAHHEAPVSWPHIDGTVLVINDVLQPWSGAADQALRGVSSGLAKVGVEVRGNALPANAGDEPKVQHGEDDVDLIASARLTLGQRPVDSADAGELMNAWLSDHEGDVDAVVWIAAGAKDQPPSVRVFGGEHLSKKNLGVLSRAVGERSGQ